MGLLLFLSSVFISILIFIETLGALYYKSIIGVIGGIIALIGTTGMAYCHKKEMKENNKNV